MNQAVFALIDCNNFFVACEKLFRPDLEGRPVVVLSSNDGCVVARSQEARSLGIPMAAPAFKYRSAFNLHGVVQFSANFDLYGDISRRIIALLTTITPRIEVYSVDESFLDLSELKIDNYTEWAAKVRSLIDRYVGIPVSIGIAPTKTLAKLASDRGKKTPELNGVLNLFQNPEIAHYLQTTPLEDVWGVGWRLAPKIRAEGIASALDVAYMRPQRAQQLMGIHGRQLVAELNGISCYALEREGKITKSIARTRTFGEDTADLNVVEAAIATFASQAAFRLRRSNQLTRRASLFLTTDKHKPPYRSWNREVRFNMPTADSGLLISRLVETLGALHEKGMKYHRAGVLLYDFVPATQFQTDLLGTINVTAHERSTTRMRAVDKVNDRYGKRQLHYAAEDLANTWEPKHNIRSPRYTTCWRELAEIRVQPINNKS